MLEMREQMNEVKKEHRTLEEQMMELQEENRRLKEQNAALTQQLKAATRRTTNTLPPTAPLPSPPKVSAMTHPAYANLNTPSVKAQQSARRSVGVSLSRVDVPVYEEDSSDEDDDIDADEASRVAKVLARALGRPDKFSGETEAEREAVEEWVEHVTAWVDALFSQFVSDTSEEKWTVVQSLLTGAARYHLGVAKQSDPSQTWDTLKLVLIDFIRFYQPSSALWRQNMDRLVYERAPCEDLLQLAREFERTTLTLPSAAPIPSSPKVFSVTHSTYANDGPQLVKAQQSARLSVGGVAGGRGRGRGGRRQDRR